MKMILFWIHHIITFSRTHSKKMLVIERRENSATLIQTTILWTHVFSVTKCRLWLLFLAFWLLLSRFFVIFVVFNIIESTLK
jgi:hypothetical protein